MSYQIKKGVISSKRGIPQLPRWFSDGRLAFQFDEYGVMQVDYRNPAQIKGGNPTVFLRRLFDGFRYYVRDNGVLYKPSYENSLIWPFGIQSKWDLNGCGLRHELFAVDESIVFGISVPQGGPDGLTFQLEFYNDFALLPVDPNDFRFCDRGMARRWNPWEFDRQANLFTGSFLERAVDVSTLADPFEIRDTFVRHDREPEEAGLFIGIGADFPMTYEKKSINTKHILKSMELEPGKQYHFVISFAPGLEAMQQKNTGTVEKLQERIAAQLQRYSRVSAHTPELISPYRELNRFISLCPSYHESFKLADRPGALKAKTDYWVWGWDGMTSNYATVYWGDRELLKNMLGFYEETADPEQGIGHCYRHDMSLNSVSSLPSQGMYINLLQQYYTATGDRNEVEVRYPFARKIFDRIAASEAGETGLCKGVSLFPDFPTLMQETGNDISGLNNTIFYCSVRSMEYLAEMTGDRETGEKARSLMRKIEDNFLKLFYDESKGFIVSSIDAGTLEKRDSFNSNAVKWENSYIRELLQSVGASGMDFFARHIVCKAGLREIPVWSEAFDAEANQMHSWWPVTGEYFMRLANEYDRRDLIDRWVGWISYWTKLLMCPEGVSCYLDTEEPDVDRWSSLKGSWYAYSMRGWYQAAIHGVVGVDIEAGGITFYPYSGEEMKLKGLHYKGGILDVEMKGSGRFIEAVVVNGHRITGTCKLPEDLLAGRKRSRIQVIRVKENPDEISVKHAYGAEFSEYSRENGRIRTGLRGSGTVRVVLAAEHKPEVRLDGVPVPAAYDAAAKTATVELFLPAGGMKTLEIQ